MNSQIEAEVGIFLAATPLGNLGDATERLKIALAQADIIAAEDTRETLKLAQGLGIKIRGKLISNFEHNEKAQAQELVQLAKTQKVLIVTDAGMPLISDPGFPLVEQAYEQGVKITCLPGASAVTTAIALCGLKVSAFAFDGFVPRKPKARKTWLESLKTEKRTVCVFESPHRLGATLEDAVTVLGQQRRASVCRELTKMFEEIKRGTLAELVQWADKGVKGEICLVIEGAQPEELNFEQALEQVNELVEQGWKLKEAIKEVVQDKPLSKKELYDTIIASKD